MRRLTELVIPGPDGESGFAVTLGVFLALLAAAALHAGWNALIRRDPDRDIAAIAIAVGDAAIGLVVLLFVAPIDPAAIPYVVGSSLIHIVYYFMVGWAYRHGELSVVYPIMRGLAPLLVAIVSLVFIEPASTGAIIGVAVVGAGIVTLGLQGLRNGRGGLGAALINAVVIASYTVVDGLGVRVSGAPAAYTAWILMGGGVATVAWTIARHRGTAVRALKARLPLGLVGGAMSYAAYAIALWAMTLAPIGAVAAVRESSVLFATALGALLLGERFGPARWVSALLVVAGLALIKLSGGA